MTTRREPLSVLISRVLVPLVWELDDGASDASLAVWANLLRVLPEEGALQRDLLSLAHVSPRSMNVLVGSSAKIGLVATEPAPKAGPRVRATETGKAATHDWGRNLALIEERWQEEYDTERLVGALAALVHGIEIELPWLLLPYGPADNSASIGPPVPRRSTTGGLPLLALLSQLLAALTLAYEAQHGWMLSMMATTFDGFPDQGMPMADVAAFAGVKGSGKTLHERHGIVTVEADPDHPKRKTVRLTEKGVGFRDRHRLTIEAVEREWAAQEGAGLTAVRKELIGVAERLPSAHVRHLCIEYVGGGRAFAEVSPRVGPPSRPRDGSLR